MSAGDIFLDPCRLANKLGEKLNKNSRFTSKFSYLCPFYEFFDWRVRAYFGKSQQNWQKKILDLGEMDKRCWTTSTGNGLLVMKSGTTKSFFTAIFTFYLA